MDDTSVKRIQQALARVPADERPSDPTSAQTIPAEMWTPITGTNAQVFVQSEHGVELEVRPFREEGGEGFVEIWGYMDSPGSLALRVPTD